MESTPYNHVKIKKYLLKYEYILIAYVIILQYLLKHIHILINISVIILMIIYMYLLTEASRSAEAQMRNCKCNRSWVRVET